MTSKKNPKDMSREELEAAGFTTIDAAISGGEIEKRRDIIMEEMKAAGSQEDAAIVVVTWLIAASQATGTCFVHPAAAREIFEEGMQTGRFVMADAAYNMAKENGDKEGMAHAAELKAHIMAEVLGAADDAEVSEEFGSVEELMDFVTKKLH